MGGSSANIAPTSTQIKSKSLFMTDTLATRAFEGKSIVVIRRLHVLTLPESFALQSLDEYNGGFLPIYRRCKVQQLDGAGNREHNAEALLDSS